MVKYLLNNIWQIWSSKKKPLAGQTLALKSREGPEKVLGKAQESPEKALRSPEKVPKESLENTEKVLRKSWESPEKVLIMY